MAKQSAEDPFSQPSSTSDVVLVVEDKELHVSKAVLALVSPVFERMFYGKFKEKYSSKVPLPDKKYDEMVELLRHIYPTTLRKQKITKHNVEAVMMLADEYQVQSIFDECVRFLKARDNRLSVPEMVHFLHLSEDKDQLKEVYDDFVNKVAAFYVFKNRSKMDEFNQLSPETEEKVLRKRLHLYETGCI